MRCDFELIEPLENGRYLMRCKVCNKKCTSRQTDPSYIHAVCRLVKTQPVKDLTIKAKEGRQGCCGSKQRHLDVHKPRKL